MEKAGEVGVGGSQRKVLLVLFSLLLVSRLVVLLPGFHDLVSGQGGVDLEARRAELEFVIHRVDPEQARLRVERAQESKEVDLGDLRVGVFEEGDFSALNLNLATYPHWSYPLALPLMWPSLPTTNWYFAGVLLLSLLGFFCWVVRQELSQEISWPWLAVLVCLIPASSWAAGIFTGQFSIPILLVLTLLLSALDKERWWLAGLLLGFAAIKPTSTALFAAALLSPGLRFGFTRTAGALSRERLAGPARAAAVAAGMVALASLLMWWWVGTDPFTALRAVAEANSETGDSGYGLTTLAVEMGLGSAPVLRGLAFAGVAAAFLVPWAMRSSSLLAQFAVLGVISRLWTYHRHYDDILLVFLLLALLSLCKRGSVIAFGALVCMATTLGTPVPATDSMELLRVAIWVAATLVVVCEERRMAEDGAGLTETGEIAGETE